MLFTVTLDLPEALYARVERQARGSRQPVEDLLVKAIQASLPPPDQLPSDTIALLQDLELMDNEALHLVLLETAPEAEQAEVDALLDQGRAGRLGETERQRLDALQRRAEVVMLRKARAAMLLRFSGEPAPSASQLRQLSDCLMEEGRFLAAVAEGQAAEQDGRLVSHEEAKRRLTMAIAGRG